MSYFSSSWCQGSAAACNCGTPWTFLKTAVLRLLQLCFKIKVLNHTVPEDQEIRKKQHYIDVRGDFKDRHKAQIQLFGSLNNLKKRWRPNWNQQTLFGWICSWEIMADAISLTPLNPGFTETLFRNEHVEFFIPKGAEHVKITTLYRRKRSRFRDTTRHNDSMCDL